jgi:hypothetical protein
MIPLTHRVFCFMNHGRVNWVLSPWRKNGRPQYCCAVCREVWDYQ